ncbi:hypothetical protein SAMN05216312_11610 [Cohnella sp. OV330]|uniref:hypothetical protein n=1 Tax=Cohnella sp. OV330 TaxID=1855288 RepID=UPI0008EEED50|nr:hypothetical protein [Cohnella sp. OV330]SFB59777.1 hypothetical protein SAMN05216312_11610 [Cohnella sp. OV330]
MIHIVVSALMKYPLYRIPESQFSPEEVDCYEKIYSDALLNDKEVIYTCQFPKHRFIEYISLSKPVLLHGSNHKEIDEFQPRKQTLYSGEYVDAVFATKDAIWSLFYAVFDRGKLVHHFRNACLRVMRDKNKYYFFSLTRGTLQKDPWTTGMVYFLPQDSFNKASNAIVSFDEWISLKPMKPITKLEVGPRDFIFLDRVSCHKETESIFVSWFLYKHRTKRRNLIQIQ